MDVPQVEVIHQMAYEKDRQLGQSFCETDDPDQMVWLSSKDGLTCPDCLRRFGLVELI